MSRRFVKPIEGHGALAITGDAIRFDVPMVVGGQDAGSIPVFAEIDKHFSADDARTLRRILADGRRRAIASTYPDAKPLPVAPAVSPNRTLTGGSDLPPRKAVKVKPAPPRAGLRFLKDPEPPTSPETPLPKRKASAKAKTAPGPKVEAPKPAPESAAPLPERKRSAKAKAPTRLTPPAVDPQPLPARKPATRSKR